MKITVLDGYGLNPGDLSWKGFEELGDLKIYDRTTPSELFERAKDSEILITNKTVIDSGTIEALPKLKYIGVLATGYNVVDTEAARKRGVVVTNIPAYSTMSVAQMVFAMLLTVTNKVEHYALANNRGAWADSKDFCWWDTPLTELSGKTFGIIGLGNIGMAVARIAVAFGMKVLAVTSKEPENLPDGINKAGIETVLKGSDVISLHCPLTAETFHIINQENLELTKDGAILINTGRGPLVDEEAVADALNSGKLSAFCGDVLSTEPPSKENPLLNAPNSYITPHIAWATKEARERLMGIAVENLSSYLKGTPVNSVV